MVCIYAITNLITGKSYIGKSSSIKRRMKEHKSLLRGNRHHSTKMQEDYNKYGEDSFFLVILYESVENKTEEQLYELEKLYIKLHNSFEVGYNSTKGGLGHYGMSGERSPMTGRKWTDEFRKKVLLARVGKNGFAGKSHTKENIEFFRTSQQGSKGNKAKLTEAQGIQLKILALKKVHNYKTLGEMFNVCPVTASRIATGKRWAHLPNDISQLEDMLISIQVSESHKGS